MFFQKVELIQSFSEIYNMRCIYVNWKIIRQKESDSYYCYIGCFVNVAFQVTNELLKTDASELWTFMCINCTLRNFFPLLLFVSYTRKSRSWYISNFKFFNFFQFNVLALRSILLGSYIIFFIKLNLFTYMNQNWWTNTCFFALWSIKIA